MQLNPDNRLISNYKKLRKLGQSSSGDVYLVEEVKTGGQWAVKAIPKKMLAENQGFKQMLDSQIDCLRQLNEPHIVKLKQFLEDNDYFYMVLEYCDVGDILNLQAKQTNRAFKLPTATEYLSQVLLSLDALHSRGYMHGQINLQNVLVKNQSNRPVLKVRFDGFTKLTLKLKAQTSVYVQYFKAPQIFLCNLKSQSSADFLGCEIDVWAFGVLFYFMLNMEFPFKLNPHLDWSRWYQELRKESENFSYRRAVRNTKKKITQNCTNEMQDLFKRMFQINPKRRITAAQLRKHPIFAPYFLPLHLIEIMSPHPIMKRSIPTLQSDKKSSPQKSLLFLQLQEINFLINITQEMEVIEQQIGNLPFLMLSYHIFKYCLILLKNLHGQLSSEKQNLKVKQNFILSQAQTMKTYFVVKYRYKQIQTKCQMNLIEISKLNDHFTSVFSQKGIQTDPGRIFFRSLRKSTSLIYSLLKNKLKLGSTHRLCYLLCSICIVHNFNKLQNNDQAKKKMFCILFNQATINISKQYMSFNRVIDYLRGCDSEQLLKLAKKIIDDIA